MPAAGVEMWGTLQSNLARFQRKEAIKCCGRDAGRDRQILRGRYLDDLAAQLDPGVAGGAAGRRTLVDIGARVSRHPKRWSTTSAGRSQSVRSLIRRLAAACRALSKASTDGASGNRGRRVSAIIPRSGVAP